MTSPRIGHAEREQAVDRLKTAYTEGRLDESEFETRTGEALRARTQADLRPLLADLPSPAGIGEPGAAAVPASIGTRVADGLTRALRCAVFCWLPPGQPRQTHGTGPR